MKNFVYKKTLEKSTIRPNLRRSQKSISEKWALSLFFSDFISIKDLFYANWNSHHNFEFWSKSFEKLQIYFLLCFLIIFKCLKFCNFDFICFPCRNRPCYLRTAFLSCQFIYLKYFEGLDLFGCLIFPNLPSFWDYKWK